MFFSRPCTRDRAADFALAGTLGFLTEYDALADLVVAELLTAFPCFNVLLSVIGLNTGMVDEYCDATFRSITGALDIRLRFRPLCF